MPHMPASPALARFRGIDLTQVRAGPTACRQLAGWGTDVIQVQMPEHMRGDDTLGGQDGSDYQSTHRNKRSITLNRSGSVSVNNVPRTMTESPRNIALKQKAYITGVRYSLRFSLALERIQ